MRWQLKKLHDPGFEVRTKIMRATIRSMCRMHSMILDCYFLISWHVANLSEDVCVMWNQLQMDNMRRSSHFGSSNKWLHHESQQSEVQCFGLSEWELRQVLQMFIVTFAATPLPPCCPLDTLEIGRRCEMRNKKFMALLSFPASFILHFLSSRERMPVPVDTFALFSLTISLSLSSVCRSVQKKLYQQKVITEKT